MSDDEKKKPVPLASGGFDRLVVAESGQSVIDRRPMEVDGLLCICGRQAFFVGIAQSGKDCRYCGSLVVVRCLGCDSWSCVGCVEKAARAERERLSVSLLADAGKLFS